MRNLFDEQQTMSEREMYETSDEDFQIQEPAQPDWKQFLPRTENTQIAYELEEEEQDIVGEAMVRLEQARLYDMLIKHDFFEGVEANHIALDNVKRELKEYIVERLQILLGIRQDTPKLQTSDLRVELPFNKLEIQALKDLAFKLTKGATENVTEKETAVASAAKPTLKPLGNSPAPAKLKTLAAPQPPKEVTQPPKEVVKAAPKQAKQAQKSNVTVNPTKRKMPTITMPNGERFSEEEMRIAQEQLEKEAVRGPAKNPYEMSADELLQRSKKIKGQAKSEKVRGIPMPTQDQVNMHYQMQQASKVHTDDSMSLILSQVLKK